MRAASVCSSGIGCPGAETLVHLFLKCRVWDNERDEFLGDVLNHIPSRISPKGKVTILLGGEAGDFTFGKYWLTKRLDRVIPPVYILVAHCLEKIYRRRCRFLWEDAAA